MDLGKEFILFPRTNEKNEVPYRGPGLQPYIRLPAQISWLLCLAHNHCPIRHVLSPTWQGETALLLHSHHPP